MSAIARREAIEVVRRFTRFYTNRLGLLTERLLSTRFTMTEVRVLFEIATRDGLLTPSTLAPEMGLDRGYVSRIAKAFENQGLVRRDPPPYGSRQSYLYLTDAGRAALRPLDEASRRQAGATLDALSREDAESLVAAMRTVERLMSGAPPGEVTLRPVRLGDIGWIVRRQAILYNEDYRWDATYEVVAARILAEMMEAFDPARDATWIAERDNETIGSVFLQHASAEIAKLRLLYVEPAARGLGIGRRLVDECIAAARERGYRTLTLWTMNVLIPARRIYAAAGFSCVKTEPVRAFGHDLVSETWELAL